MSGWKTYKLSELVEIKYGKDHKHLADGEIPLYGSGGIMRYVDTPLYEQESILIPRKGTLSNLFYLNIPFWSVDTMFYTKIKEGNNGKYLYYLLKSMDLASMNVGSAVPSLTTEVLNKVEINVPDEATQQEIAQILTSLDDKIELNLQMNQTLEAMAKALFKEWCWVEDGVVPEGWTWKKLLDIADVSSSKRIFRDEYILNGVPFYRGKEVTQLSNGEAISTELFISEERHSEIKEKFGVPQIGDILITSVGTIGSVWLVDNDAPFYFKDGNVTWIKDYKTAINGEFVYQWLQTKEAKEQIKSVTIGSSQQALTISALRGLNILIPDTETVSNVLIQLEKINAKRINNLNQIQTLTQTRDTLLPKLMSGKLELV
ncbi:restriction endonuclease subunit S [Aquirufa ecclesiirivi]|uniref:restriction endonuclease subunit S n=1 Tax=Aquirufa ecclesiirivi TaxID=2715124 RepID=UPI003BB1DBB6